jgi:hypothetical protein
MKQKEREREAARKANQQAMRISIELSADGRLTVASPGVEPLAVIAILEVAKHTLLTQQARPIAPEPKSNIIVPNLKVPH